MHFLIISIIYGINYWIFYTIYSVKYPIYYPLGVASRKDEILYKHEIQVNTKNTAGVKLGITVCVTYGQDIVDNQPCKGEIMCCCLANDNHAPCGANMGCIIIRRFRCSAPTVTHNLATAWLYEVQHCKSGTTVKPEIRNFFN
jgi:hypothetical protein